MVIRQKYSSLTLPWPVNWDELFGVERPIIVEIGFGNGDYLVHLAQSYPDHHVIGFEISNKSLEKAEGKIINRGLDNALAIHSRGETALHHLFTPQSIRQIHINYPDPWFKSRHAGRRIMQRDTLDVMVNRLEIGGLFYLATDIRDYADMSHELLTETPGLTNRQDSGWSNEMPDRQIVTKYEQRGYREGRPGHFFSYIRNEISAPDVPVQMELTMPHLILKTPQSPDEIIDQFEKTTHDTGDDIHVTWTHAFINRRNGNLLFELTITEPTIDQHIALMMMPREEPQTYTLRYATMGHPRPTAGLHRATNLLGDWIVSLHPDAEILDRRLKVDA